MIEEETRLKASLERMKAAGKKIKGYDLQSGRLRDVISSMLHVSKTKIAQIEAVNNNLIPEWKEELKGERLTFSAAYELSGMTADEQREALGKFTETGELTHKDVKDMKAEKAAGQQVSESDTETEIGMNPPEVRAGDEYETPHPEGITSICYSCTEYETCNVKTGTCTSCDQYKNRTEAYKTDEQRYSEEQDAIDRENDSQFVYIAQMDEHDDRYTPENWIKANPILEFDRDALENLIPIAHTARDMGGEDLRDFLVKQLNMWMQWSNSLYIKDIASWKACAVLKSLKDFRGSKCYVGVDLSSGGDLTSIPMREQKSNLRSMHLHHRTDRFFSVSY